MKALITLFLFLNLNTATLTELDRLPGVGPVLAKWIMEFRERKGCFQHVEDLLAISGVSEKQWWELRTLVTVVPVEPN